MFQTADSQSILPGGGGPHSGGSWTLLSTITMVKTHRVPREPGPAPSASQTLSYSVLTKLPEGKAAFFQTVFRYTDKAS